MKRGRAIPSPERIAYVERLKALLRMPMSAREKAEFRAAQAREMAAAERRRQARLQLSEDPGA